MKYKNHTIRAVATVYEIWDLCDAGSLLEMKHRLSAEDGDIVFYQAFSPKDTQNEAFDVPLFERKSLEQLKGIIDKHVLGENT